MSVVSHVRVLMIRPYFFYIVSPHTIFDVTSSFPERSTSGNMPNIRKRRTEDGA